MKEVSVKVVDRRRLLQSADVAALQDEIDALRELVTCPQIIELYEVFEEPDSTFLVMELMKGGNLIECYHTTSSLYRSRRQSAF